MLKILIISPIIGIISISNIYKILFPTNTYNNNNIIEGKIEREIGMISGIITYLYIIIYIIKI